MRRVHLHSGGISSTEVRAGTGGRKPSQWRTENTPPPRKPGRTSAACARCTPDKQIVAQAEAFLKEHKQPPLHSTLPVQKGAPGSNLRRKAKAAADRVARCPCKKAPAAKKSPKPTSTRTTAAAARRATASTDPYQQVLAHDRVKSTQARRKR